MRYKNCVIELCEEGTFSIYKHNEFIDGGFISLPDAKEAIDGFDV